MHKPSKYAEKEDLLDVLERERQRNKPNDRDLKSSKSMVDIKKRSNKAKLLKLKNQTFEVPDQPFWMQASQQSRINRAKSPAQDRPKRRNPLEESLITSKRKQSQRKDNLDNQKEAITWINNVFGNTVIIK